VLQYTNEPILRNASRTLANSNATTRVARVKATVTPKYKPHDESIDTIAMLKAP
jgi:hypothetical protein